MCPFLITLSAVVSQDADFFDLPQQGSILRWKKGKICPSQIPDMTFITGLIQFVVNTNDYRCSRQPEWSLWPSEEDFSSGHWTDRRADGWRQRKHKLSYKLADTWQAYLTTVRSRAERASLWKVMTTLDAGRSDFHCLCLQLQEGSVTLGPERRASSPGCTDITHTGVQRAFLKHASCGCSRLHKL